MVEVIRTNRKSAVLTPSGLNCLSRMPTVNLTSGCAHGCLYCYARGYTTYPGEGRITLYANTLERLRAELPRKRKKPRAVYFSPSSDLFQPIPDVLDMAYDIIEYLFQQEIGVAFLTKGRIPERHMRLLKSNPTEVRAGTGLISLDNRILRTFEPNAASAETRLSQMKEIVDAGIVNQVRLDPVLPGLTDDADTIESICAAVAKIGVKRMAVSVLFLRAAVAQSLNQHIPDRTMRDALFNRFNIAERIGIHAGRSNVTALPGITRRRIHDRVREIAGRHEITLRTCSCKNPDVSDQCCSIAGNWDPSKDNQRQLGLFDEQERTM